MHEPFIRRCLELAEQGRGYVGNGAMVGAVLVREGKLIAEGFHAGYGKPHAERELLQKFDQEISSTDVLYVNMEPCCPGPDKKNSPCTDIIQERGIKHVVLGMVDPDARVAGKGIALLRSKGVTVEGPVLRTECEWFNRGYTAVRIKNRPWITMHHAFTADGRVANLDGSPLKITSAEQDAWAHQHLRARNDAILVGVHTVVCDNPTLTVRLGVQSGHTGRAVQPYRIILDPHCKIPLAAKVVTDEHTSRTILVVAKNRNANAKMEAELHKRGLHIIEVAIDGDTFDWDGLWKSLMTPDGDYHGITSVLVEGGPSTWERFRAAGMMDEEVTLIGK